MTYENGTLTFDQNEAKVVGETLIIFPTEEEILEHCRDQKRVNKIPGAPNRVKNEWMTEDEINWSIFTNLGFMGLSHYWISKSGIVLKKRFDEKKKSQKRPQYKYCFQTLTGSTAKPREKRYWYVSLIFDNRKRQPKPLHYLLARTYVEGFKEGLEVDHIDGNTQNNFVDPEHPDNSNLRWVTHSENIKHSYENPDNYKQIRKKRIVLQ